MINNIPMYPKKRTLKNVIADYYKSHAGANSILSVDGAPLDDYGKGVFAQMGTSFDLTTLRALYTLLTGHYKYAVIGFDSDDEFVDRFSYRWLTAVPVQGRAVINSWQTSLQKAEKFTRETSSTSADNSSGTDKGKVESSANGASNSLERTIPTLVNEQESKTNTATESSKTSTNNSEHSESVTEKRDYTDILALNDAAKTELVKAFFAEFENLFVGVIE